MKKHNGRLAFTPTATSREYFDGLIKRLQRERGLEVRVTQREAFDHLAVLAKQGEEHSRRGSAA